MVYPGHGGLEVLLCFEGLDNTDLQDLNTLMGGDVADCLPALRQRVAPITLAAEVNSIAGQRELAALLSQFPLDHLAKRMINSFPSSASSWPRFDISRRLQQPRIAARCRPRLWWPVRTSTSCVVSGLLCVDTGVSSCGLSSRIASTVRVSCVKAIATLSSTTEHASKS
ncbi:hypothetical protein PHMEG_00037055 [Phytophthora megakarya]|uniref:Uncharacterized protein n=1 Tax=Phytophthora megakarya TaxID=4795 RepID=A0A225UKC6_9STRA|nr:hypothetical protein PHMEG_00037055 [Phytophthora megakarya]